MVILGESSSFVIILAGTNGATYSTVRKKLDNILTLKFFITHKLPNCEVVISTPTLCADNRKAALTVSKFTNHLLQLDIDIIDKRKI